MKKGRMNPAVVDERSTDNSVFLLYFINTNLHREGGGGGTQIARANFKDSYLCNE